MAVQRLCKRDLLPDPQNFETEIEHRSFKHWRLLFGCVAESELESELQWVGGFSVEWEQESKSDY